MTSKVFKRSDIRYIAAALAHDTTHDGITVIEVSMGIMTEGTKTLRATQLVKTIILERPDADQLILELLNYLYLENPYADTSPDNQTYATLQTKVLGPRGVTMGEDGFAYEEILYSSDGPNAEGPLPAMYSDGPAAPAPSTSPLPRDEVSEAKTDRTEAVDDHRSASLVSDAAKVFVVHGRDMRPLIVLRRYLLFLGLHVMSWSEAVALTKKTQPHTYDIVKAGIDHAAAVVIIFSPDDLARVKDDFSTVDDLDRSLQGQARQNVTLEAGMAFATAPNRTIFLRSEATRSISDIEGFNWVKMDGSWDSRADLKSRLEKAGAAVRTGAYNLADDDLAGPFKVG